MNQVPNAEIVADLDYYFVSKIAGKGKNFESNSAYSCDFMNDVQIIAQRTSKENPKKDQLFLIASNDGGSSMFPIDLRRVRKLEDEDDGSGWETKIKNDPLPAKEMRNENALYSNGLQMRFMNDIVRRREFVPKAFYHHGTFVNKGKNFHVIDAYDGSAWMEFLLVPHMTMPVNFYHEKFERKEDLNFFPISTLDDCFRYGIKRNRKNMIDNCFRYGIKRNRENMTQSVYPQQEHSFLTFKMIFRDRQPKRIKYRGTACCLNMIIDDEHMKVGITHTVTKNRAYLSAFYAFRPYPPFDILHLSGYFCLSGMQEYDVGYENHWMSSKSQELENLSMNVYEDRYDCPPVTFASGITEKVGNSDLAIISYGVNDCYSRSITIPKWKIEYLLKGKL